MDSIESPNEGVFVLRKLLIAVCFLGVICAGVVWFVTRNVPPDHPALKAADLPPLISTIAFYADPRAEYSFVASADGAYTASFKAHVGGAQTVVREVNTNRIIASFPSDLKGLHWHPDQALLRFLYKGDVWQADPLAPEPEDWARVSPADLSGGWMLNEFATDASDPLLYWGKRNARAAAHMWLVSRDGTTAEKIAQGNEQTEFWVFDTDRNPVLRADSLDAAYQRVFRKSDDGWQPLFDLHVNDTFQPVDRVQSDGTLLARSSRGRDKIALVSFDTETGQETVLLENPDVDIGLTTSLTYDGGPDLIRMGFDSFDRVALSERGQTYLDILAEFPQPSILGETHATPSGRFVTQALSPAGKSWVFLLIDLETKSYRLLGESFFRAYKDHLPSERVVTFSARDGLDIPAVLTLPKGVSEPIPFVVHIHGGPADISYSGYTLDTQFLVNRGYGVLSVNFRGSTGFGKAFQAKGFKEFGRAMQDDIADAALWLVEEGLADPDALIAMGMSYGGYSAALAMTRDPGLFDAAIVEFPMLDVEFQSKYHPWNWKRQMQFWTRYFGKLDNPDDVAQMRKYSPVNRVADLHGPVLILGGERDQVTAIQQVRDFELAAQEAGKEIKVHYFPNAGHGLRYWRYRLTRARLIEGFLAEQAGGRAEALSLQARIQTFFE